VLQVLGVLFNLPRESVPLLQEPINHLLGEELSYDADALMSDAKS
jgi:hypothetical protein